jgi:hypothetical protein
MPVNGVSGHHQRKVGIKQGALADLMPRQQGLPQEIIIWACRRKAAS